MNTDRNQFTVKRLQGDSLAPVTFHRGEYVSAYLTRSNRDTGEITGISHALGEFAISGRWYKFGSCYKAERPIEAKRPIVALSKIVDQSNAEFGANLTEADRVMQ